MYFFSKTRKRSYSIAEGRAVHSRYFLYKILTQKGTEGWGDVSISWGPWHEERPGLRARVITPDDAVHLLDEKTDHRCPSERKIEIMSSAIAAS